MIFGHSEVYLSDPSGPWNPTDLITQLNPSLIINGEIYNQEYFSNEKSDTTILSENLDNRPIEEILSTLNGPFSFIKYNKANKKLYFGRDKFGRRSLLLAENDQNEFFISSVAVKLGDDSNFKISYDNWDENILAGEVYCKDLSSNSRSEIFMNLSPQDVTETNASTHMEPDPDSFETEDSDLNKASTYYQSLAHQTDQFLTQAITTRTKITSTDYAPNISVFFSGGLDSSLIAYYLGKMSIDKCSEDDEPLFSEIELVNVSFYTDHGKYNTPDKQHAIDAHQELKTLLPNVNFNLKLIDISKNELNESKEIIAQCLYPRITILDESLGCALYRVVLDRCAFI